MMGDSPLGEGSVVVSCNRETGANAQMLVPSDHPAEFLGVLTELARGLPMVWRAFPVVDGDEAGARTRAATFVVAVEKESEQGV